MDINVEDVVLALRLSLRHRKLLAQYNDLKASGDLNPNKRALDRVAEKFG